MASRSRVEFDDYYRESPRRAPSRAPSRAASRGPPVRYADEDIDIHIHERDRTPAFLRDDRRSEAGQMVLRQREVETVERPRRRSPSPVHMHERIVHRARSVSPEPRRRTEESDIHIHTVDRVRESSRPPADRIRASTRIIERQRSPSPPRMERLEIRETQRERQRPRSPSPDRNIREHIRIVEREKEREPSPPPQPQQPQVIKGPVIEREVITHYRDIDHGMISVRPPSRPASPVRRKQPQLSETEIDIYTSRKDTEIDIHRHASKSRGRSQERRSPRQAYDDDLLIHADTGRLHVDVERRRSVSRSGRRAHSEAPPHIDFDDEARYITSKIDSRGQMGEAYNGITKDWTIIDVPPGTERVRLDGAGGASAEVTWQKYSGVRRSQFIPERDERSVVSSGSDRDHDRERDRDARDSRLSIQIYNDRGGDDRERVTEKVTDRRISIHGSQNPRRSEMWTEITKDLVTREAIEELGYDYEETEYFFYIMQYLRYEDVLRCVQLSDKIRQARKDRIREIQWEREYSRDDYDFRDHHHNNQSHSRHRSRDDRWDDERERIVEHEVIYDSRAGGRYR
ncbi:hypothetical protein QBC45DRAFT_349780 [Copromyces sp. CBS 386.78]|nr:hypothetical protein QBC45DRAFT_349780 [Copromyces sp. CBS 386.78]